MKRIKTPLLLATAGAATLMAAILVMPMASAKTKMQGLSKMDKEFLKKVNGANLSEAAYAPVVMKRAAGQGPKNFAQRMVQDHTKANNELKMLARQKGVKLPGKVPDEEQMVIDRLAQESGSHFDMAYQHEMIRDHTADIGEFEREISLGRDASVKAFAAKTLPVLKQHLQLAQDMNSGMKTGMNSTKMSAPTTEGNTSYPTSPTQP